MIIHLLKIILRKIKQNISFFLIKIVGLSIGLSCSLALGLWIFEELDYDKSIDRSDSIYRVMSNGQKYMVNGTIWTPGPLIDPSEISSPGIENTLRISPTFNKVAFRYQNKRFYEERGIYVDTSFFNFFNAEFMEGDKKNCLSNPNSIIITTKLAIKYFGKEQAINKILSTDQEDFIVSGVINPFEKKSSLKADFIIPLQNLNKNNCNKYWSRFNVISYVLLSPKTNAEFIGEILTQIAKDNHCIQVEQDSVIFKLQPLLQTHLDRDHGYYLNIYELGSKKMVYIFSSIAIFLLLIALINYINLTTANSKFVEKEIKVRKIIGASRGQLTKYIYFESFIIILFSFALSIVFLHFLIPKLNYLTNKQVSFTDILQFRFIILASFVFIITWIFSGAYPAFYINSLLSRTYWKLQQKKEKAFFRKSLIITQFFITAILLLALLALQKQIRYINKKELGFNPNNILCIPLKGEFANHYHTIKNKLLENSEILSISCQDYLWASLNNRTTGFNWKGKDPDQKIEMHIPQVGFDFIKTMGMHMVAGRSFDNSYSLDSSALIVNECAASKMNIANPIDFNMAIYNGSEWEKGHIIGVVKDMHFKSLKTKIEPMVIRFLKNPEINTQYGVILIRYKENTLQTVIDKTRLLWDQLNPNIPFDYHILKNTYHELYIQEENTLSAISFLSILSIFISCLGLYGLIKFLIDKKEKEISIRKVNGANTYNIIKILISDFIKLVCIAFIIATPISYYLIRFWLQTFEYRILISLDIYLISFFIVILVVLITIIYKSYIASTKNPIEALKYE